MRFSLLSSFAGLLCALLITGCVKPPPPPSSPALPVLKDRNVLLYWDQGTVKSTIYHPPAQGISDAIFKSIAEHYNQNDYRLQYGPENQVAFMTNLRKALLQWGMGKDVTLMTAPPMALTPNDLMISIYFKTADVMPDTDANPYQLKLDTWVYIKDCHGPLFKKEFELTENFPSIWGQNDDGQLRFGVESSTVSATLQDGILKSIVTWYKQTYPGTAEETQATSSTAPQGKTVNYHGPHGSFTQTTWTTPPR